MKYYFRNAESEHCYQLEKHLADAADEGLEEVQLHEAVPEKVAGMFYCRALEECTENNGYCGRQCTDYTPKNGKTGMCIHKQNHFYIPDKIITFKVSKS
jgi:hypothetical protein